MIHLRRLCGGVVVSGPLLCALSLALALPFGGAGSAFAESMCQVEYPRNVYTTRPCSQALQLQMQQQAQQRREKAIRDREDEQIKRDREHRQRMYDIQNGAIAGSSRHR